tara:strand:- start:1577 stop:1777 length:201 start_codon:yes stop_codon:yes gene_type:complete
MGSVDFTLTSKEPNWFSVVLAEGAVTTSNATTSDLFNNEAVGGNAKRVKLRRYCKKCEDKERCVCA